MKTKLKHSELPKVKTMENNIYTYPIDFYQNNGLQ